MLNILNSIDLTIAAQIIGSILSMFIYIKTDKINYQYTDKHLMKGWVIAIYVPTVIAAFILGDLFLVWLDSSAWMITTNVICLIGLVVSTLNVIFMKKALSAYIKIYTGRKYVL